MTRGRRRFAVPSRGGRLSAAGASHPAACLARRRSCCRRGSRYRRDAPHPAVHPLPTPNPTARLTRRRGVHSRCRPLARRRGVHNWRRTSPIHPYQPRIEQSNHTCARHGPKPAAGRARPYGRGRRAKAAAAPNRGPQPGAPYAAGARHTGPAQNRHSRARHRRGVSSEPELLQNRQPLANCCFRLRRGRCGDGNPSQLPALFQCHGGQHPGHCGQQARRHGQRVHAQAH